jgi:hypothetical protein
LDGAREQHVNRKRGTDTKQNKKIPRGLMEKSAEITRYFIEISYIVSSVRNGSKYFHIGFKTNEISLFFLCSKFQIDVAATLQDNTVPRAMEGTMLFF